MLRRCGTWYRDLPALPRISHDSEVLGLQLGLRWALLLLARYHDNRSLESIIDGSFAVNKGDKSASAESTLLCQRFRLPSVKRALRGVVSPAGQARARLARMTGSRHDGRFVLPFRVNGRLGFVLPR